jgi:hypothetical protein
MEILQTGRSVTGAADMVRAAVMEIKHLLSGSYGGMTASTGLGMAGKGKIFVT